MIRKKIIELKKVDILSKLVIDYSNFDKKVEKYISSFPIDYSTFNFNKKIDKNQRENLVSVISKQYKKTNFYKSDLNKVNTNISSLLLNNSQTVTTGHQLNILASPLFLIYKIINVINLSNQLSNQLNKKIIPIFWMATEDHDFEEIKSCNIFKKTYNWNVNYVNQPVSDFSTKGINFLLDEIDLGTSNYLYKKELLDVFKNIYSNNKNYVNAHRALLTYFFSSYGLVILDANDPLLKKNFISNLELELKNNYACIEIEKTNKKLSKNYKPILNPMDNNIFYFRDSLRIKIIRNKDMFYLKDKSKEWSLNELIHELKNNPERFSPNVILRTLYQEKILPNLAYIGGPSEISYWLQLKSLFKKHNIDFPVLILRNFILNLSEKDVQTLNKFNLKALDLFNSKEFISSKYLKTNVKFNLKEELLKIEKILKSIKSKSVSINDGLNLHTEIVSNKIIKDLIKLEKKLVKGQKSNHLVALNKINDLFDKIYFNGIIQERASSYIPYYMKYGSKFFNILVENLKPLEKDYVILEGF